MSSQLEIDSVQKSLIKKVLYSYGKFFMWAAILALVATFGALWINSYQPLPVGWVRILQILGAVIEVTALGNMGWELQTWDGDTPAERLNRKMSSGFALLGFSVLVFSWQLI